MVGVQHLVQQVRGNRLAVVVAVALLFVILTRLLYRGRQ
jgi:hypothetical protein